MTPISATGTLEASIARNMAYIAYEEAYSSITSDGSNDDDDETDPTMFAVLAAQEIERQSINTADLSIQELVDCDTRYDQVCLCLSCADFNFSLPALNQYTTHLSSFQKGCAGGNPLLAFYFLHRFGITSSKKYPYTGTMGSCKYSRVDEPIATVKSWGILTPDHENNMEKVLRYIGKLRCVMIISFVFVVQAPHALAFPLCCG